MFLLLSTPIHGAGVTLITHGFQLDKKPTAWLGSMARAVATQAGTPWSDVSWYQMQVGNASSPKVELFFKLSGPDPDKSLSGEIIVTLDWSELSGLEVLTTETGTIAALVVPELLADKTGLGGALAQLPFHLIGHSRGGSVVHEITRILGKSGIWVDQVTTLDPHPSDTLNDAPVRVWDNVVFTDNYWRKGLFPSGQAIAYAYNVQLVEKTLNEEDPSSALTGDEFNPGYPQAHSDVHLWYHGTIGPPFPTGDGEFTVGSQWYNAPHPARDPTGFHFGRLGGGVSDRPQSGLHPFHGGLSDPKVSNRHVSQRQGSQWANIDEIKVQSHPFGLVKIGDDITFNYFYQDQDSGASVDWYFDNDSNPYNNPAITPKWTHTIAQAAPNIAPGSITRSTAGVSPGTYRLYAKITSANGGHVRYSYASLPLTFSASTPFIPAPIIKLVSPTTLPGVALPQTQLLTITGSGFLPESKLEFFDGVTTFSDRKPIYDSETKLRYNVKVGNRSATWTVKVINGSLKSGSATFTVTATPDAASPARPIDLTATFAGGINNDFYYLDWTNPNDASGLARVWWKLGTVPSSPADGVGFELPLFKPLPVSSLSAAPQTVYVWLEDSAGNKDHNNRSPVILRQDTGSTIAISTSASPSAGGITSGSGSYPAGTSVNVVATPNASYAFVNWTEGGTPVSSSASYLFTATANRTLVANFSVATVRPTITTHPKSQVVSVGADVMLSVVANGTPPLSYQWRKNGVELAGATSSTFTLNNVSPSQTGGYNVRVSNPQGFVNSDVANLTVNASGSLRIIDGIRFVEPSPYYVNGTVTADLVIQNVSQTSISLNRIQVDASFLTSLGPPAFERNWPADNFSPPLVLAPNATYRYTKRLNQNDGGNLFTGVPATATARVYVVFTGIPGLQLVTDAAPGASAVFGFQVIDKSAYTLSLSAAPASGGSVSGTGSYLNGANVTVQATANTGYSFVNWTENGVGHSSDAHYSFLIGENRTLTANFALDLVSPNYTISAVASLSNGGVVSGGGTYSAGSSRTVTATANQGFTFVSWSENGNVVSKSATYVFTLTVDRNLVANFNATPLPAVAYAFTTLSGVARSPGQRDNFIDGAPQFKNPAGVAVDSAGNVYVGDAGNNAIRKITRDGVVSTLAGLAGNCCSGDGKGTAARFNVPIGVAVDGAGNVYVADNLNHTIRKITASGLVSTLAGLAASPGGADGAGNLARFHYPRGVAVDNAGNVYVADTENHTIRKITSDGQVSTLAGLAGSTGSADGTGSAARFTAPSGVAVDGSGNVYVGDAYPSGPSKFSSNHTIRKITRDGVVSTLAGWAGRPGNADGTGIVARFDSPVGVAVDSANTVYVVDQGNSTIRKVTPDGVVSTLAGLPGSVGSRDGVGNEARFSRPQGLAVDSAGNVYVADTENHTIRKGMPTAGSVSVTITTQP